MSKIIAVDFDGTVVTHEYPKVGRDVGAVPVLKRLVAAGHRLILYTMRSDDELQDAIKWFNSNGVPIWGVNENPEQKSWTSSPKVYAHVYIDDAALGTPLSPQEPDPSGKPGRPYVNWLAVEVVLGHMGLLPRFDPH